MSNIERTLSNATSVDWPTYCPSSFRMALLHSEPMERVLRRDGVMCTLGGLGEEGSSMTLSSTVYTSVTVCSFFVRVPVEQSIYNRRSDHMCRVPVLSEQMTETEPKASTECSFLTIALRLDIRSTPSASVTVVTMGSPSGMAATASDTVLHQSVVSRACLFRVCAWSVPPIVNISNHERLWITPMIQITPMIPNEIIESFLASSSILSWSGVRFSSTFRIDISTTQWHDRTQGAD